MLNTPGIPSVIRKRAQTPPHLRNKGLGTTSGGGRERRKSGEKIAKDKEDQQKTLETIFHAGDILEAAKILDLNILRDTALLWIAEEFWLSPLPDNWEEDLREPINAIDEDVLDLAADGQVPDCDEESLDLPD